MKKIFAFILTALLFSLSNNAVNKDANGNIVPCVRQNVTYELDGSMFITILIAGGILMFLHNLIGHWIEHHGRYYFSGIKPGQEGSR